MGDYNRHSGDEDGDEDEERSGPMLGFLFGNVDISGDLDEEYLDQDVKEHLSALAGQLKDSLVDIKESGALSDVIEGHEDYNRKADNAVDYEDIQEEYEGPELQLQPQVEDSISQDQSFYAQAALERPSMPLGEDEDYDEDDDYDKVEECIEEIIEVGQKLHVSPRETAVVQEQEEAFLWTNKDLTRDIVRHDATIEEEIDYVVLKDSVKAPLKHELPVLYEEDGKEVLKFSELFGQDELPWVCRRDRKYYRRLDSREKSIPVRHELLEEDELALLKSCTTSRGLIDEASYALFESERVESEEVPRKLSEDLMSLKPQAEVFRSAQPMKEDLENLHESIQSVWIPSPNLQLIHQEDWETAIIWDEEYCHKVREDHVDTATDTSGFVEEEILDTREDDALSMRERDECWQTSSKSPNQAVQKSNMTWQASRPVVVEPLCKKTMEIEVPALSRHPQLLRLELLPSKSTGLVTEEEQHELVKRTCSYFRSLNLQSYEIQSGTWLDHIIWDEEKVSAAKLQRAKVIFNFQDDHMVFQILESKDIHHLKAHAAAMIITPQSRNQVAENGEMHLGLSSLARFNISNDKYYMNKKNQQQQKSNFKKRSGHGIKVLHSTPAIKLQTMKPKLANKDLANFHRPRAIWYPHHNEVAAKEQGSLSVSGPMKVILKSMGGKGSKLTVDALEPLESLKVKASKKFGDLRVSEKTKIFCGGRELQDSISLAEQEVKPNSILHLVRTKVHLWPKAQRLPGESKPTRPPGAFKKKSDLSVKDGHVFIAEYCEERPLLLSNVGMGARLCTYYRKITPTDSTAATLRNERGSAIGIPIPLEPTEDSPFLGDIRPGDTQTCLETNMFRAPAFYHKVLHTDYLLVRSSKGKLSLRRIDHSYVVGQQEPHMEVFTPSSKIVQTYLHNRLLTYLYREFRSNEKPGSVTRLRADEVIAQFPSISEGFLRKRLRHCADLQRTSGGELWIVMKRNFRIPSEEELRRMVIPENVCGYESMQAGLYHLKRIGVSKLTQPTGLSAAMNQLPGEALVLATASHLERELQITPWNLSYNFVAATMHGRGSLERLEITGAGDPSGRGLGFSYLRVAPKPPGSSALVEKKAAAARGGGAVTGTNADLRRLSMDAAREVLLKFNVPDIQIEKLTRWHRIALVRKLSSERAASGVKLGDAGLNKFARGQRMSFLQLQQQTREKCQEIWDRQVRSLSIVDAEYSESEGEANEDLDSFAGDLENLLEAEEGETEEVASAKSKKETIRGSGAWRRALEAQREDIEDEEAEAAELRRMLMEDDEAEDVKKKKKACISENELGDVLKEQNGDLVDKKKVNLSKKKKIIKRIIRTKQRDGTYTSREVLITDPKEVAVYLARKNASQNGDQVKEKKGPLSSKKVKQTATIKDGKKPKKPTKGEGAKELQLICGACGRMGHMRTNKKVCPLYTEEGRAKIENIDAGESTQPSRTGIKITLKSGNGRVQEKEQAVLPENKIVESNVALSNTVEKKELPPTSANKHVTPKIIVKTGAGARKEKEQMPSPASSTITPKLTVKTLAGPVQEKEEYTVPLVSPTPIKSIKLKLPVPSNSDVANHDKYNVIKKIRISLPNNFDAAAAPSTSKMTDNALVEPFNNVGGSSHDTSKKLQGSSSTVKKIKVQKRSRSDFEVTENNSAKVILDTYMQEDSPISGKQVTPTGFSWDHVQHGLQIETEADTQSDNQVVATLGNYSRKSIKDTLLQRDLEEERLDKRKKKKRKEKRKAASTEEKKNRDLENERDKQREMEQIVDMERSLKWKEDRIERKRGKNERQSLATEREYRRESMSVQHQEIVMFQQRKETERTRQRERKELQWLGIGSERLHSQVEWVQEQEETQWELQERTKHTDREKLNVRKDMVLSHGKRASTRDRRSLYQERSTMKRRASIDEDIFDDVPEYTHHQPKRRKGGEVSLANILENVINTLKENEVSYLFRKPVTKKEAPDYLDVIKNPMDLSTIREKARKLTYKSRQEFRRDVWQIAENAHIYNDNKHPAIPPLADKLLVLCDELLLDRADDLARAEASIERLDGHHIYASMRNRR